MEEYLFVIQSKVVNIESMYMSYAEDGPALQLELTNSHLTSLVCLCCLLVSLQVTSLMSR